MYKHRQIGWVIWSMCLPVILVLGIIAIIYPTQLTIGPVIIALAILIALILFGSLTVFIDQNGLGFYFGPGIIRKYFNFGQIESAKKARNHWFWGWGIRWFGRGWLYSVSGLDSIEIHLKSGKILRVGTNEPDKLLDILSQKIKGDR